MIFKHLSSFSEEQVVPPSTILLEQGNIADRIYFIEKGCVRQYIIKDGVEITIQFFMEGDFVSSAESFKNDIPSQLYIESIEKTHLFYITKSKFRTIVKQNPLLKAQIDNHIFNQFVHFQHLFLSRLMYSPQERYECLLKDKPEFIQRIPSKYIASFLGITPVSLSRIRGRIS